MSQILLGICLHEQEVHYVTFQLCEAGAFTEKFTLFHPFLLLPSKPFRVTGNNVVAPSLVSTKLLNCG